MNLAFVSGFSLGISLIMAIGAQNAFVLRQGIRGEHVFAVCLTCALSDAILIAIGVLGAGAVSKILPDISAWMRWAGAAFLLVYGARSFWRASNASGALEPEANGTPAFWPTVVTCLILTWANPHVYLDTVVLLGSVSSRFGEQAIIFGAGAMLSSFVFFFGLGYGARVLRRPFASPLAWRFLDLFVGVVMWAIAAKLILG